MGVNRFDYFGETIFDITDSTVSTSNVLDGEVGYSCNGERFVGSAKYSSIYTGSTTPSSSLGKNGDIYIQK